MTDRSTTPDADDSVAGAPGRSAVRALARNLGVFHNISYYAPEMKAFADVGLDHFWRAYMAYRSAPMGPVSAGVVTATFYNFAPVVVEAAIPSAWDLISPQEAIDLRDDCIDRALRRALGSQVDSPEMSEAAELALAGISGADVGARPLFAAHCQLPVPDAPHMRLWHAATLWREHRGDGHNLALAAAGLDGVECHVLLAGRGVGNREIITKIRGWTADEWDSAQNRLADRGLVDAEGKQTAAGRDLRRRVENQTDELGRHPSGVLGPQDCQRLIDLVEPMVGEMIRVGAVPGSWPPPSSRAKSVD